MTFANSPVTEHIFDQHRFFLKRDDLLHPQFSGNKARKFMGLLNIPATKYQKIASYGSAQSNAMYSLAALAKLKGWQFDYYVASLPSWLKANPIGNYAAATALGMQIHSMQALGINLHSSEHIENLKKIHPDTLFVPEGGRARIAEPGIKQLAKEIIEWMKEKNITNGTVALPSGTGTTALYLQKHLKAHEIDVLTCACVGNEAYLREQFTTLEKDNHPTILPSNKHHFGQLYQAQYQLWQNLLWQTQVEFDLLYDPLMWQCLLPWFKQNPDRTLLYIHQGGLLGNESMLARLRRKFG